MEIDSASLEDALTVLGQLLADRGHYFEIVAIGGGGLLLLKLIERTTKDLDLVALVKDGHLISAKPLPKILTETAEEVGIALDLGKDWLNGGPTSLLQLGLPAGFENRMHTRRYKGLTVHFADRFDQICFKLYASVDHEPGSKHFTDLITLRPSLNELEQAKRWCLTHDVSEPFEKLINQILERIHASS